MLTYLFCPLSKPVSPMGEAKIRTIYWNLFMDGEKGRRVAISFFVNFI
jgi:hypothetical protein